MNERLMIFYRNPSLGMVKTRLAATVGDAKALAIYLKLVAHTRSVTSELDCEKVVFYSDYIDSDDSWPDGVYKKALQRGASLGERMAQAFQQSFNEGASSVIVMGTDWYALTKEVLEEAFHNLRLYDGIIGPASDGGYYLLGLKKFRDDFFRNKSWSTETVAQQTVADFKRLELSYHVLDTLPDIQVEGDLPAELRIR